MKNLVTLLALVIFIASCDKEDEIVVQQDPPIVNISKDTVIITNDTVVNNFGDPITFTSPQRIVHYNYLDTFTVIKGGLPPYYIKDKSRSPGSLGSPTITAFISNDTLFYTSFGATWLTTITVSDNRDYNTSQFSFISTFEESTLSSSDITAEATDGGMLSYTYDFDNPDIKYYGKNDSLSFRSFNNANIAFSIKGMKVGNESPEYVSFYDDFTFGSPFSFIQYSLDQSKVSNVKITYGLFKKPSTLEFELHLESTNIPKDYITLKTSSKIVL